MSEEKRVNTISNKIDNKILLEIYQQIINSKIDSFEKLLDYLNKNNIKLNKQILNDYFLLIKKLFWGKFENISKENYPELWEELVIKNREYNEFGDLKKYMTISEIYVAILDIHGYTKFCQETKNNILLLKRLDQFVNTQVVKTAGKYGVLSDRERGDEIILIGANVCQILCATLEIINLFSKEINLKGISDNLSDFYLPAFKISAGIAGGQPKIPLLITENGELSGFLLNMASRLQTRANTLSPDDTKIIVEQYVVYNFNNSNHKNYPLLNNIKFFDNGEIEFKGIKIKTFECYIYKPELKYKEEILPLIRIFQESIKENQWQSNVLFYLFDLVINTAYKIPKFKEEILLENDTIILDNDWIIKEFSELIRLFSYNNDYDKGMEKFEECCKILEKSKYFDKLIIEYCKEIYKIYKYPYMIFKNLYNNFIKENKAKIFSVDENKLIDYYNLLKQKYDKFMFEFGLKEDIKTKKKYFWNRAIELSKDKLFFNIYSGKK